MKQSKKHQVQTLLLEHCLSKKNFVFHNDLVKEIASKVGFSNPFDATKIDNVEKLADSLRQRDYFILHIGKGYHKFVKGIERGYHEFEKIKLSDTLDWTYKQSLLNESDDSESNVLSVAFNQKITHHFLYGENNVEANVYQSRRSKLSFQYNIGKEVINIEGLQLEVDQTCERNGIVTIVEAKNGFHNDFAIYQIYIPYLYYTKLAQTKGIKIKHINCCYLLRKITNDSSILRMYLYEFNNPKDMTSLRLEKSAEYKLIKK